MQSRFEAQKVEFLAVSELLARFKIVLQGCIHVRLVCVHHVLLTPRPEGPDCLPSLICIASRRGLGHESVDLAHLLIREAKLSGAHHTFRLVCIAGTHNRSCDRGIA